MVLFDLSDEQNIKMQPDILYSAAVMQVGIDGFVDSHGAAAVPMAVAVFGYHGSYHSNNPGRSYLK